MDRSKNPHPLILKFQNEFGPQEIKQVQTCRLYKGATASTPLTAVLLSRTHLYSGREHSTPYCDNYLLARNRLTGKQRLIPVGCARVSAVLPDHFTHAAVDKSLLKEKFGSKRQKRNAEQSKRTKVDVETVKEQLEASALSMEIDPADMTNQAVEAEASIDNYIPFADRDATDPLRVYKLSDIITREEMESLKTTAAMLLEEDTYDIDISDYITALIEPLRKSSSSTRVDECCALLYTDCILRFITASYKIVHSPGYVLCTYSDIVNKTILRNFSVATDRGNNRPKSMVDKAACYVIVLLLILGNCKIPDIETFRKGMNITMAKLIEYVKVVGARITSGEMPSIVLKIPLSKPPALRIKRNKK